MKDATVTIKLKIPNSFNGVPPWSAEETLEDFVSHWLEEGYYAHDHIVELPQGIRYFGFTIQRG
ncbi:hypothetical protein M0R72_20505 [Candidatus Pacearchaeota archaeon]|jgi:hypothetical protein|nr:hypothetical protein [Candidatus Pacearchaeota archaeon]